MYPERMRANIEATKGQVMAEAVMVALVGKGMGRQEALRSVRDLAMTARAKGVHLADVLKKDPTVAKHLRAKEIEIAMDPERYLGASVVIVDDVAKKFR